MFIDMSEIIGSNPDRSRHKPRLVRAASTMFAVALIYSYGSANVEAQGGEGKYCFPPGKVLKVCAGGVPGRYLDKVRDAVDNLKDVGLPIAMTGDGVVCSADMLVMRVAGSQGQLGVNVLAKTTVFCINNGDGPECTRRISISPEINIDMETIEHELLHALGVAGHATDPDAIMNIRHHDPTGLGLIDADWKLIKRFCPDYVSGE